MLIGVRVVGDDPLGDVFIAECTRKHSRHNLRRTFLGCNSAHVGCVRLVIQRRLDALCVLLGDAETAHVAAVNVHLTAENVRHRGCEYTHDLGIAGLDNALREHLCVIKQVNIILQKIKTKFLNVEAAVGNTVDKRMVQIAFPDVLRCGKQSFGCFVVQGGTPNESMLMIFLRLTAKFCRQHFSAYRICKQRFVVSSSAFSRLTASIRRVRKEAVPSISLRTRASAVSPQCFITSDAVTAASNNISGFAPQYTPVSEVSIQPAPVIHRRYALPPRTTAVRVPSVITSIAPVSMTTASVRRLNDRSHAADSCKLSSVTLSSALASTPVSCSAPAASARTANDRNKIFAQQAGTHFTPERAGTGGYRIEHDRTAVALCNLGCTQHGLLCTDSAHVDYKCLCVRGNLLDLTLILCHDGRAACRKNDVRAVVDGDIIGNGMHHRRAVLCFFENGFNGFDQCLAPSSVLRTCVRLSALSTRTEIAAPTAVDTRKDGTKVNRAALVLPITNAAIG